MNTMPAEFSLEGLNVEGLDSTALTSNPALNQYRQFAEYVTSLDLEDLTIADVRTKMAEAYRWGFVVGVGLHELTMQESKESSGEVKDV